MTDEDIRLECLRIATGIPTGRVANPLDDPALAVAAARQYADFVLGTKDAEIVEAANRLDPPPAVRCHWPDMQVVTVPCPECQRLDCNKARIVWAKKAEGQPND